MRTIIEVPEEMIKTLDQVRKRERRSRASIIREAIRIYLEQREGPESDAAFGLWREKRTDGLKYQEELRSEWSQQQ